MTIQTNSTDLAAALARVERAADPKPIIPIFGCVLIQGGGDGDLARVVASNSDVEVVAYIDATCDGADSVAVSARDIAAVVKGFPKGQDVTLRTDDEALQVACGRSRFRLLAHSGDDFPIIRHENATRAEIPAEILLRIFEETQFACSANDPRYYLNGVYMHDVADSDEMRAVATDGHILAMATAASCDLQPMIIPHATVRLVMPLLKDAKDKVALVSATATTVRIDLGNAVVTSKLIDGPYPEYHRTIPENSTTTLTTDKGDLVYAITSVTALLRRSHGVVVAVGKSDIAVSAAESGNDGCTVIDADVQGNYVDVGLNSRLILSAFRAAPGDTIRMQMTDAMSPVLIDCPDIDDWQCVLMPMRI